jgi:hypothetical protein
MGTRKSLWLLVLLAGALILIPAACGGDDGKDTPPSNTAVPASPAPLVRSETISCERHFSFPGQTVTYAVNYPAGWLADCPMAIEIKNQEYESNTPPAGVVKIFVTVDRFQTDGPTDPADIMRGGAFIEEGDEVTPLEINGRPAALGAFTGAYTGFYIALTLDDTFYTFVTVYTTAADVETFKPLVQEMSATINVVSVVED